MPRDHQNLARRGLYAGGRGFQPMSLRRYIIFALVLAGFAGALVAGSWYQYGLARERHLVIAFNAGIAAHSLATGQSVAPLPFIATPTNPTEITSVDNATRLRFTGTESLNYETSLSIAGIAIRIYSKDLQYSLSEIKGPAAAQFGQLFRSIATFCGAPLIFLETPSGWQRLTAPKLFSCQAAPPDWRTPILIAGFILLATLLTIGLGIADHLSAQAAAITRRAKDGRTTPLPLKGPSELQAIAKAINRFFDREKLRHSRRATLLLGISHDLGTPTQRLKLRTALIRNQELRQKLDADIDQMTQMIDSVLAYTRNEMDVEEMRKIPILGLLQALVDDYADLGRPVKLLPFQPPAIRHSKSVFSAPDASTRAASAQESLFCNCRPNAIRRALTNLVDNALNYGKTATLSLSATPESITVFVEDEGMSEVDFTQLVEPFQRGKNARHHRGTGLGLTIVESIAASHGGTLGFSQSPSGTVAAFQICR
ncbi:MAG: HAMP domain-containing histidine kinase [Rhodobacteraceae bacterium]|nr:HAMP domain-containing histidine kinase [Paracoccaceae bacterium]